MSTKKDKFSLKDNSYMRLALDLAKARKGLTGDNPSVGCLIVKNDKIISIGQTGFNGRPHAEYNAIKNCSQNLNGSKMYVTLEPCNHYGKTPPCTKNIIKKGISEELTLLNINASSLVIASSLIDFSSTVLKLGAIEEYLLTTIPWDSSRLNILSEDVKSWYILSKYIILLPS